MPITAVKIGDRFGLLTVVAILPSVKMPSGSKPYVQCQCICGASRAYQVSNLKSGASSSCNKCPDAIKRRKQVRPKRTGSETNLFQLYQKYKFDARKRNLQFLLSLDDFRFLTQQPCTYCGDLHNNRYYLLYSSGHKKGQPRAGEAYYYNGLDRTDSNRGYCLDNVVTACLLCNRAKCTLTVSEFAQWIRKLINRIDAWSSKEQETNIRPIYEQRKWKRPEKRS